MEWVIEGKYIWIILSPNFNAIVPESQYIYVGA